MKYTLVTKNGHKFTGHNIRILEAVWGRKTKLTLTLFMKDDLVHVRCDDIKELLPEVLE